MSRAHRHLEKLTLLGAISLTLTAASGCEKLRPLTMNQGQGENLHKISEYNGRAFLAYTGAKRFRGQTSKADEVSTVDGFDLINDLDAVELFFKHGLFAEVDLQDFTFYGKENSPYRFQYGFTDDYVILFKIARREDIPSQELTYAQEVSKGSYKVPLMGLPISLYTVETVRDERGKETRKTGEYLKDYLRDATHFRLNLEGIEYFDAPSKQDLFPTDFFSPENEWFLLKTLVGRPINGLTPPGRTMGEGKVRFARTNNSIIGVDLNIAPEQEILDPTKTITVFEIPVEWVDFRLQVSGDDAMLKETKLGDEDPTSRFWRDRAYALVDFTNSDRLAEAQTQDSKLEQLEVGDDYLSFTIYHSSTGNTVKYSLAKSNRVIDGQRHFTEDATLFHVFTEKRRVMPGSLSTQIPDIERSVHAERFFPDPENPEIVYYLSDNSPNDPMYMEAVRTAIEAWDVAFQEAGTNIRVRFSEERVPVGDVRYNQIVLWGYEIFPRIKMGDRVGVLLGYGPSVHDSRNGQTFSATVNIYLRSYREGLLEGIRSFLRNELGLYDDKTSDALAAYGDAEDLLPAVGSAVGGLDHHTNLSDVFRFLEEDQDPAGSHTIADIGTAGEIDDDAVFQPTCEHGNVAARSISWEKIREACLKDGHLFADYLARLTEAHLEDPLVVNVEGEKEALIACAEPLMKDTLISTLIHEVGHNLGLGHNFAGSSDGTNHAKNDDGSIAYPSSSVMDYPDRNYDLFTKPGPYDVAALAFLYGRRVETSAGEFIDVPVRTSALEAARRSQVRLKDYRMCVDWEVAGGNLPLFDPLCSKWDHGSTPLEYVHWAIRSIHADLIENGYRYNDLWYASKLNQSRFVNFKQIHDYFRYLVSKQAGLYFKKLPQNQGEEPTEEDLLEAIGRTSDPELTMSYYEAVKEIFNFCRTIIDIPSRVCVVQDMGGDATDLVEFRDLRSRIFDTYQVTVQNCQEAYPYAGDILFDLGKAYAEEFGTMTFLDRGVELNGLEISLDPDAVADWLKQVGFHGDGNAEAYPRHSSGSTDLKTAALYTLFERAEATMMVTREAEVGKVNFLDFPWFSRELFNDGVKRITEGMNTAHVDDRLVEPMGDHVPLYREYEDFNVAWILTLYKAGSLQRSLARPYAESLLPTVERSLAIFGARYAESEDSIWYVTTTRNQVVYDSRGTYAAQLIQRRVEIGQLMGVVRAMRSIGIDPLSGTVDLDGRDAAQAAIRDAIERSRSADPDLAVDDRLFEVGVSYLEEQGLNLQPAQRGHLRRFLLERLAAAAGEGVEVALEDELEVEFLTGQLGDFVLHEILNREMLELAISDGDNLNALVNTLDRYINAF